MGKRSGRIAWLLLLGALFALPVSADTSRRRPYLLYDDFSRDPAQSRHWTVRRWDHPTRTREPEKKWRPFHEAREGIFYLTRRRAYCGMAMFATKELRSRAWSARFRFRTSGKGRLANGFVFCFYKEPVKSHATTSGSSLAFEGTRGYGIFFDSYANDRPDQRSVSLIHNSVFRPLAKVADRRVGDQKWHDVEVLFLRGHVVVRIDGEKKLDHRIRNMDYSKTGLGFTAAVGAALTDHAIDDFVLESR